MGAGNYPTRFAWLVRERGKPDEFGQKREDWPNKGYLWGVVEDVAAGRRTEKESEKQVTTAVVRLRNYPAVAPGDVLRDTGTGDEWEVMTAVALDNETYCEVER